MNNRLNSESSPQTPPRPDQLILYAEIVGIMKFVSIGLVGYSFVNLTMAPLAAVMKAVDPSLDIDPNLAVSLAKGCLCGSVGFPLLIAAYLGGDRLRNFAKNFYNPNTKPAEQGDIVDGQATVIDN